MKRSQPAVVETFISSGPTRKSRAEYDIAMQDAVDTEHVKQPLSQTAKPKVHKPSAPRDPLAIRTVVVSGLPSGVDAKVLWKKFRKQDGAEKVEWPLPLADGNEDHTSGMSYSHLM